MTTPESDWQERKDEQARANEAVLGAHPDLEGHGWPKPEPPRIPESMGNDCGARGCACDYYPQHINEMQEQLDRLFAMFVQLREAYMDADLLSPRTRIENLPLAAASQVTPPGEQP